MKSIFYTSKSDINQSLQKNRRPARFKIHQTNSFSWQNMGYTVIPTFCCHSHVDSKYGHWFALNFITMIGFDYIIWSYHEVFVEILLNVQIMVTVVYIIIVVIYMCRGYPLIGNQYVIHGFILIHYNIWSHVTRRWIFDVSVAFRPTFFVGNLFQHVFQTHSVNHTAGAIRVLEISTRI